MTRWFAPIVVVALLLAGCTGGTTPTGASPSAANTSTAGVVSGPVARPAVPALASLRCGGPIDGALAPAGFQTVLGVVALPTSPASPALQASASGDPTVPTLFAKTGLWVRAGHAFELAVPDDPVNRLAIGWGNALAFRPSARFAVPSCPDVFGTGWVIYPGGYWADRPLCLPLTVRAGGREQQVRLGIGTPCPGQEPPAS
jgi:hypothetical protein